jgi:flavin-dependent dehydrogenase
VPGSSPSRADVDVAVVGAGPAGAAAALAVLRARPGTRVALLDRAAVPRDKACGDGVAPHALDVLARLGVTGLVDDLVPVRRLGVGFPDGAGAAGAMRRAAYVVPRTVLDARLVQAAVDRGAILERRRVRTLQAREGLQVLDGDLAASVVIGADGAHSRVAAALDEARHGARRPPRARAVRFRPRTRRTTAVALRGYAPVSSARAGEQIIALASDADWPAYAWSFPIGDGRANVGYGELLPADGPGPSKARMLDRLDALLPGAAAGGSGWRGHHLPLSTGRRRQPDGPVLLAGDALGLVNPLTGEGIHAAVLSGALAGLAAVSAGPGGAGRSYRLALRATFGRHHRHVGVLARLPTPRVVAAGLRAADAAPRVFDDLVELGLADGAITTDVLLGTLRALLPPAPRLPARTGPPLLRPP